MVLAFALEAFGFGRGFFIVWSSSLIHETGTPRRFNRVKISSSGMPAFMYSRNRIRASLGLIVSRIVGESIASRLLISLRSRSSSCLISIQSFSCWLTVGLVDSPFTSRKAGNTASTGDFCTSFIELVIFSRSTRPQSGEFLS